MARDLARGISHAASRMRHPYVQPYVQHCGGVHLRQIVISLKVPLRNSVDFTVVGAEEVLTFGEAHSVST